MQKKLIALAVAGLASAGAFAQSNVTIYGIVDASAYGSNGGNKAGNYGCCFHCCISVVCGH